MQQAIVNFVLVTTALFVCAGIGAVVYVIAP
jgi:phage shock protein PspC (stress-responsive transcriptional regulator)